MFPSEDHLARSLVAAKYIIDPVIRQVVYLADRMQKPIIIEGPPGTGKTELAAIAQAGNAVIERLQCYEGITEEKAIGRFDPALQELFLRTHGERIGSDWQDIRDNLHSLNFFVQGPLLRALLRDQPCVLLIDEVDKVDQAFTRGWSIRRWTARLRFFRPAAQRTIRCGGGRWRASRQHSRRDRCRNPRRLPNCSTRRKPSTSWVSTKITPEMRDVLLPFLAKTEADRRRLMLRDGFHSLVVTANKYRDEPIRGLMIELRRPSGGVEERS